MNEEQREGRDLPIADSPTVSLPDMLKLLLMIVLKRIFSPAVHSAFKEASSTCLPLRPRPHKANPAVTYIVLRSSRWALLQTPGSSCLLIRRHALPWGSEVPHPVRLLPLCLFPLPLSRQPTRDEKPRTACSSFIIVRHPFVYLHEHPFHYIEHEGVVAHPAFSRCPPLSPAGLRRESPGYGDIDLQRKCSDTLESFSPRTSGKRSRRKEILPEGLPTDFPQRTRIKVMAFPDGIF